MLTKAKDDYWEIDTVSAWRNVSFLIELTEENLDLDSD